MHPLFAHVEANAFSITGFTTFGNLIRDFLRSQIDTVEERKAIEDAALKAFDAFVAPRIGPAAAIFRPLVVPLLDSVLIALAA